MEFIFADTMDQVLKVALIDINKRKKR
jgi:hypothetical protein